MRTLKVLALLLPVVACGPVQPTASLPPGAVLGATDPMRSAIFGASYAFNNPGGLASPGVAARACAQLEYLAANVPQDARYSFTPTLAGQLAAAREELRQALGVAPGARPQEVVDGLYFASAELDRGNPANAVGALSPTAFPNPQATLARLASLGRLPLSATATAQAEREHLRLEYERINQNSIGAGGGRP